MSFNIIIKSLNIGLHDCICNLRWEVCVKVTQSCLTLYNPMGCSLPGSCPWTSPGQNTGVGSLSLLQGIFPMQGLNPGLLHCRQILYLLSHKGNPRVLEWVNYPFSSGSSQPRNWTGISCIAGRFFTNWAMREAHMTAYIIWDGKWNRE